VPEIARLHLASYRAAYRDLLPAAFLAGRGFATATRWVLAGNERARAFYAAMGWAENGRARGLVVNGVHIPEIRYRIGLI
jgi:predicted GNAT superfamily acetyltransferase